MRTVIQASAPGKVILAGEHSVVYGQPALVMAIDKRAFTNIERIEPRAEPIIHITTHDYDTSISTPFSVGSRFFNHQPAHLHPLLQIIQLLYVKEGLGDSLKIDIRSDIPKNAGLGSSAAVCVSLSAALVAAFELEYTLEDISALAFEGEKVVHGTPSGVDNTVATFGGCLRYHQGRTEPVRGSNIQLIIGDTGIPRETKTWISKVRTRYDTCSEVMALTVEAMGRLVGEAEKYLAKRNLERLGEMFDISQGLLSTIGVSIPQIDQLVNAARTAGAYGAKLTGAGGGGNIFALVDEESQQAVVEALQKNGVTPVIVNSEAQGVKSTLLNESLGLTPPKIKTNLFSVLAGIWRGPEPNPLATP
ncbi:MAG: mevalonate kinase [Candidatus Hodarchaeales archaeon]|jgi:mevalonate kinase